MNNTNISNFIVILCTSSPSNMVILHYILYKLRNYNAEHSECGETGELTQQSNIGEKPFQCINCDNLTKYSKCREYMEISINQYLTIYRTPECDKYKANSLQLSTVERSPINARIVTVDSYVVST